MIAWFVETTVAALALAAVAALLGRWGRFGPVARHALWLVVLVKMLTPPLVSWPRAAAAPRPRAEPPAERAFAAGPRTEAAAPETSGNPPSAPIRPEPRAEAPRPRPGRRVFLPSLPSLATIGRGLVPAWGTISVALALVQAGRVVRFRRGLRLAVPAPPWLVREAGRIASEEGVEAPEILVLPGPMSPMLWFLGRPKLLVPARLLDALSAEGWRGVLAHELAHLGRRDHWVRRLELVAGLIWWWNPLYWVTRRRLDAEAELACDERAVRRDPDGRLAYAEALLVVCRSLNPAHSGVPALGAAGAGRFLERRMTMILNEVPPARSSIPALLGAGVLALLAVPAWGQPKPAFQPEPFPTESVSAVAFDDDDEDDDEDSKPVQKDKDKEAKDKDKEAKDADKEGKDKDKEAKRAGDDKKDAEEAAAMAKELAETLKEQLGPGSDFEKAMQKLGEEMATQFGPGSDFVKSMEKLGEEMEAKFGPGSDFEKSIELKFGPGSDFEKRMEKFGKSMEAKFGPGSDFEKRMEKFGEKAREAKEAKAERIEKKFVTKPDTDAAKLEKKFATKPDTDGAKAKSRRVEALRAEIEKLSRQLKEIEEEDDEDDDNDDDNDNEDDGSR